MDVSDLAGQTVVGRPGETMEVRVIPPAGEGSDRSDPTDPTDLTDTPDWFHWGEDWSEIVPMEYSMFLRPPDPGHSLRVRMVSPRPLHVLRAWCSAFLPRGRTYTLPVRGSRREMELLRFHFPDGRTLTDASEPPREKNFGVVWLYDEKSGGGFRIWEFSASTWNLLVEVKEQQGNPLQYDLSWSIDEEGQESLSAFPAAPLPTDLALRVQEQEWVDLLEILQPPTLADLQEWGKEKNP